MSAQLKPRSDSRLKTLPPERQDAIIEYMRDKSLPQTVAWLRAGGLHTSVTSLSEFYSWYQLRQQLKRNESTVQTLLAELTRKNSAMPSAQIEQIGQAFFTALALEQQDVKSWFLTQRLGLQRQQLELDREKFQRETCELFLKWFKDEHAKQIASSSAPNSEKIDQLGQLMFGELWKAGAK